MTSGAAMSLHMPPVAYWAIAPEVVLVGAALVMLALQGVLRRGLPARAWAGLTIVAALASGAFEYMGWRHVRNHGPSATIAGAFAYDGLSVLVGILISAVVVLYALIATDFGDREGWSGPEAFVLALLSASGGQLMAAANDLIVLFLGLEILSIALYVMTGMEIRRASSGEAAMKYLVLGGFSSAIFVYGIALAYGATGSTNLSKIASFLAGSYLAHDGLLLAAMFLIAAGFAFKVAAAPFHLWTPDVYQGAPSPATAFMAAAAKAAGFAGFLRVFATTFVQYRWDWRPVVWALALLSLVVGAAGGLAQRDVKRMLAYSAINHSGFILLGLVAGTQKGISASLVYLVVYAVVVVGSFGVVSVAGGRGDGDGSGDGGHAIAAYRGLAKRQPFLAGAFALLLVAQAGIPPTAGFVPKLSVLTALLATGGSGSATLAVIAMLTAVVSAFFYLRVVLVMYGAPVRLEAGEGERAQAAVAQAVGEQAAGEQAGGIAAEAAEESEPAVVGAGGAGAVGATAAGVGDATAGPGAVGAGRAGIARKGARGSSVTGDAGATGDGPAVERPNMPGAGIAIALAAAFTVVFGVYPAPIVDFAQHAASLILH